MKNWQRRRRSERANESWTETSSQRCASQSIDAQDLGLLIRSLPFRQGLLGHRHHADEHRHLRDGLAAVLPLDDDRHGAAGVDPLGLMAGPAAGHLQVPRQTQTTSGYEVPSEGAMTTTATAAADLPRPMTVNLISETHHPETHLLKGPHHHRAIEGILLRWEKTLAAALSSGVTLDRQAVQILDRGTEHSEAATAVTGTGMSLIRLRNVSEARHANLSRPDNAA